MAKNRHKGKLERDVCTGDMAKFEKNRLCWSQGSEGTKLLAEQVQDIKSVCNAT